MAGWRDWTSRGQAKRGWVRGREGARGELRLGRSGRGDLGDDLVELGGAVMNRAVRLWGLGGFVGVHRGDDVGGGGLDGRDIGLEDRLDGSFGLDGLDLLGGRRHRDVGGTVRRDGGVLGRGLALVAKRDGPGVGESLGPGAECKLVSVRDLRLLEERDALEDLAEFRLLRTGRSALLAVGAG